MRLASLYRSAVPTCFAAALMVLATSQVGFAQTAPEVSFLPASTSPAPVQDEADDDNAASWAIVGGVEFDTDGMLYGFFGPSWKKPLNDNVAVTARVYGNWLKYEFEENGGLTQVSGPGVSLRAGLDFGDENSFGFGVGPSFKWRGETFTDANGNETEIDSDMEIGFSVGADAMLNPTDHDNIHAIISYETVDGYLWSRLGYKHQISNHDWRDTWAHSLGVEGIAQGNDDIRTLMIGGLVEFLHAPSGLSLMVRSGLKRSSFDVGDDRTGPYFGLNLYRRLN